VSENNIPSEREFTVFSHRPPLTKEGRATRRYRCGPAVLVVVSLANPSANVEAWAHDMSQGGVGLRLPYPLDVGVAVMLRLPARRPVGPLTLSARVAHSTAQADGAWRVGCAFEQHLDAETLEALL